jgi:hypothetical protein
MNRRGAADFPLYAGQGFDSRRLHHFKAAYRSVPRHGPPHSYRQQMVLIDPAVRNAKGREKPYKLSDERGLYLLVNAAGKYWRLDYRFAGERKTLALGVYPDVSLANAREKRDVARKQIADGIDPSIHRRHTARDRRAPGR